MNTATQTIADTATATAQALLPAIIAAAAAGANPAVAALVPVITNFIQSAIQLHNAGAMTQAQLAEVFKITGTGIRATHDEWVAMNSQAQA